MKQAIDMIRMNHVEEIKFVRKDYSELYTKREVDLLAEVVNLVKEFEDRKLWTAVECENKADEERYKRFILELLGCFNSNPVTAYEMLVGVMEEYMRILDRSPSGISVPKEVKPVDEVKEKDIRNYLGVLEEIKNSVERCRLIRAFLTRDVKQLLKPSIQPTFISSFVDLRVPENTEMVSLYKVAGCDIRIYEREGERYYFLNPPELWLYPDQVALLNRLNEYISREHSLEVFDPKEAREYFRKLGCENLAKLAPNESKLEIDRLAEVFSRYSAGYGLLEILFRDRHIMDIFVDSPPGSTPVYINHEKYGSCVTNIYLTEEDMERLSSKFRAISERPFDEANPILDMELKDVSIRVAGVREPSTFEGLAYAFRKHSENPWTLARFVKKGMLTARSAALLSFLISGQSAMLITGARGSGKTSLLTALLTEVDSRDRIILMEDTAELPSKTLKDTGWKIEHLKNQSAISSRKGYELAPEDNLRAALRLGESVLVLGEVRGTEARVLFEAMRVGAAGNSVLGTIHGSTPYDTWDRVVHDLGVPATSFKAVDVIVCVRYREIGSDCGKARRVMQITEVGKRWDENPEQEGAFIDLMRFNEHTNREEFFYMDSDLMKGICNRKGITLEELDEIITVKERIINDLIQASQNVEEIIEATHIKESNNRYRILYFGKTLPEVYPLWSKWFKEYLANHINNVNMGVNQK
jgi:type IV secretory pathway ATPase VirB11/archaellum biosynthesis ATPase